MIIEIENLNFSFGKKEILKNINLEINSGEKTIIIGPNGCGKTTLLRLMSGYLSPNSGKIILKGRNIKNYSTKERSKIIAMMHQNSNSNFDFKVEEVISMGRYPFIPWNGKFDDDDYKIIESAIDLMELYDLKEKYISEISGGEKARVMAARTFVQDTELVLMDEPISAMDVKQQIKLMNIINEEDRTFIIVLHDLNLASIFADRIVLMNEGKIIADGSPSEVITTENIRAVYGVNAEIVERYNRPYIIPEYKMHME